MTTKVRIPAAAPRLRPGAGRRRSPVCRSVSPNLTRSFLTCADSANSMPLIKSASDSSPSRRTARHQIASGDDRAKRLFCQSAVANKPPRLHPPVRDSQGHARARFFKQCVALLSQFKVEKQCNVTYHLSLVGDLTRCQILFRLRWAELQQSVLFRCVCVLSMRVVT